MAAVLVFLLLASAPAHGQTAAYTQSNLVSDGSVSAQHMDPALINPWGIAAGKQTPFWVNEAGSGFSAVYDATGTKQFAVTVPAKAGSMTAGTPSGIVFNAAGMGFTLPGSTSATFLFVTLDGTISGWNASTPKAVVALDNSASGAVYTGAALVSQPSTSLLLAANFSKGKIDVFNAQFMPASLSGSFADPNLPAGFSPYGIHTIGSMIFVTYAQLPSSPGPAVTGAGMGYVDAFDVNGNLIKRVATAGTLNAPWGVVLAPASFGPFGGDLLVGNFGDGTISAFDAASFAFKGQLQDAAGHTIANAGLWDMIFGAQGSGDPNTLYFSAGVNGGKGGLLGAISAAGATPPASGDFAVAPSAGTLTIQAGGSGSMMVNLSSMNSFTGQVSMACSGLPAGLTCAFSPASVDLTTATGGSTTLTVSAAVMPPSGSPYVAANLHVTKGSNAAGIWPTCAAAVLFPLMFAVPRFRRLSSSGRVNLMLAMLLLTGSAALLAGCGGMNMPGMTNSQTMGPATFPMTVNATSGAIMHTVGVMVTVNQ